jgi:ribonuclease HI
MPRAEHWVTYFDGSLISPKGEQLKYVFHIIFEVSNNEAEYEALLHGLCLTASLGTKRLLVYGDSLLVVQNSQQGVGHQQRHHGRVCHGDTQIGEQVLRPGDSPCVGV